MTDSAAMAIEPLSRKAKAQRRSARGVAWAVGCFVALQVIYYYPLAERHPQLLDGEFGTQLTNLRRQIAEQPVDLPLIVGLGSSLTKLGFRPDALACCELNRPDRKIVHSFGMSSGLAISQLICLNRLLAEGIRPDWVVVEVFPRFYFLGDSQHSEPFKATRLRAVDLPLVDKYYRDPRQVRRTWLVDQIVPWYSRRNLLQNLLLPSWVPKDNRISGAWTCLNHCGWAHSPEVIENLKRSYHASDFVENLKKVHDPWNQTGFTDAYAAALRELIDRCRAERIGVVVVRVPESSFYRATFTAAMREKTQTWLARLVAETGAVLVDAEQWLTDDEFADGFHADPQGAVVFTRRLEDEVLQHLSAAGERRSQGDALQTATMPNRTRRL